MPAWSAGSREDDREGENGAGTRTRGLGFGVLCGLAVPGDGCPRGPVGGVGHSIQVAVGAVARHPGGIPSDFASRAEAHDGGPCTADEARDGLRMGNTETSQGRYRASRTDRCAPTDRPAATRTDHPQALRSVRDIPYQRLNHISKPMRAP